jgi:hypothetical protein
MKSRDAILDRHVALLTAFVARVDELSPSAWARIKTRCSALSDPSFGALLARTALLAKSQEMLLPEGMPRIPAVRVIKAVTDGIGKGFAFAFEAIAEFDAASEPMTSNRRASGTKQRSPRVVSPRVAALIDAHRRLEAALRSRRQQHPGVVTAVRAAAEGVLHHAWLTPVEFDALYQYVAPEIPFTSLTPPAGQSA